MLGPEPPGVCANREVLAIIRIATSRKNFFVIVLSLEIAPRRWFPSSSYSRAHTEKAA
jgi:hypothetical protein